LLIIGEERVMTTRQLIGSGLCILLAAACGADEVDEIDEAALAAGTETAEIAMDLIAPIRATSAVMVEFGNIGAERSEREDVRQLAATVATDHRAVVQVLDSVAAVRGVSTDPTAAAAELANSVRMAHAGLAALEGSEFDLTFIRAQVESHRQFLDRIELELVPAATSSEMQIMLSDVRAMEAAHLTRARQILASILGQATEPATGSLPTAPPPGPPPPGGPPLD
jgi:predicted outer membrane protein